MIILCFWVFIGMGPILYMEDMGVKIEHFGFYQGVVAGCFAIISLMSPMVMNRYGQIRCFKVSTVFLVILAGILAFTAVFIKDQPMLITALMAAFGMGFVFPVNVLWPASLEIVPDTKARASALMNVGRLSMTGLALEVISYIYGGRFLYMGLFIFVATLLSAYFFRKTAEWNTRDHEQTKKMAA